jgi:hypothetical protein
MLHRGLVRRRVSNHVTDSTYDGVGFFESPRHSKFVLIRNRYVYTIYGRSAFADKHNTASHGGLTRKPIPSRVRSEVEINQAAFQQLNGFRMC